MPFTHMPLSTDTERGPSSLRQENKEDGKKISTRKRMALLRETRQLDYISYKPNKT